ncbi:unnamed protein product [Zymoseptoria tritici ST99CH_1A5]|uniref:BTB domain-containing protein n=2 Tax=Zymoseptoria tritici TaxID=1047171 RepID=A0A2H1H0H7_ZYMTR|nr:unnamed protein product [Zymoseptoria tritici ST99CH_1E4]SMR63144.1 unnamed protein product [Zymoseptoria tritici ST99CH_3D1]SMY28526.1 unnamed protein product [Zymoseptoria tritici ST99CH_1A5]
MAFTGQPSNAKQGSSTYPCPQSTTSGAQLRAPNPALWGCDDYADVTIKCIDRDIKCHKIILSTNSEYFRKSLQFGLKLKVPENNNIIELTDDDPDAVETVLKYIYTCAYDHDHPRKQDTSYHVGVIMVAGKYLLPTLQAEASIALVSLLPNVQDEASIMYVVDAATTGPEGDELAESLATALESDMLEAFVSSNWFRLLTDEIGPLRRKTFELFRFALSMKRTRKVVRCPCGRYSVIVRPEVRLAKHIPADFDCCRACGAKIGNDRGTMKLDFVSAHKYLLVADKYEPDRCGSEGPGANRLRRPGMYAGHLF